MPAVIRPRARNRFVLEFVRPDGTVRSRREFGNTVLSNGKDHLLELGAGLSADHLDAGADLELLDSGDVVLKTIGTQVADWPKTPDDPDVDDLSVELRWEDESGDDYGPIAKLRVKSPAGIVFSEADDPDGYGHKQPAEKLRLRYVIQVSSNDGDLQDDGMERWLRSLIGDDAEHFDAGSTVARLYDGARTLLHTATPRAAPEVDSNEVTIDFEFDDGEGDGDWSTFEMDVVGTFAGGDVILRSGGTGIAQTKAAGDVWVWRYTLAL